MHIAHDCLRIFNQYICTPTQSSMTRYIFTHLWKMNIGWVCEECFVCFWHILLSVICSEWKSGELHPYSPTQLIMSRPWNEPFHRGPPTTVCGMFPLLLLSKFIGWWMSTAAEGCSSAGGTDASYPKTPFFCSIPADVQLKNGIIPTITGLNFHSKSLIVIISNI